MICCAFARLILCRYIFVVFFFLFLWLFSKFDTRSIWMWKFSLARAVWAHDISDWKIRRINAITCRGITTFCTQPRAVWDEKYFCVSALEEFFALLEKCVRVCDTTALTWVSLFWVGKKSTYSQDNQHKQAKDKARELQLFLNGDNFWAGNETLLLCHKWPTGLDFSSAQLYHLNRRRRRCLGLSSAAHIGGCRLSYFFYFDNMLSSSLWSVLLPHFARFTGLDYTLMLSQSDNHTFFFLSFSICLSPAPTSSHVFSLLLCCNLPAKAAASSRQRHDVV